MRVFNNLVNRPQKKYHSRSQRQLSFESFEPRRMLAAMGHHSGVMITEDSVVTPHDTIPRFAANATFIAIQSGDWSNPDVWNTDQVPGAGAIIRIPDGIDINYDIASQIKVDAIEVFGRLDFETDRNTSLWLNELMVMPGGTLTVGTPNLPVSSAVTSRIIFADTSFEDDDPEQFGIGLIVLGELTVHGAAVTSSVRATQDLATGATSTAVDREMVGWRPGDRLVVPQTAQAPLGKDFMGLQHTEVVKLQNIDGLRLEHDATTNPHHGISDNPFGIERFAHIGNLTRNVILESENPNGVRGHVLVTGHGEVDIAFAHLQSLGRTRADSPVDNTVIKNGSVVHWGTNQIARYPLHLHHSSSTNSLSGSVVEDNLKWGVVVHATNNTTILDNVIFDTDGSAIMTEAGTEQGSIFRENLVIKVDGGHQINDKRAGATWHNDYEGQQFLETGVDGSGFWLRTSAGIIENNTVYDAAGYGFNFNGYYLSLPDSGISQVDSFSGNETVSSRGGLWSTYAQGQTRHEIYERQVFENFLAWHVSLDGVHAYHDAQITFRNVTVVGDPSASNANQGSISQYQHLSSKGLYFGNPSYENFDYRLEQIDVSGMNLGIVAPAHAGQDGTSLTGARLANHVNIGFASEASQGDLSTSNVQFLPSLVGQINQALPNDVANIWHEGTGTIVTGVLDPEADLVTNFSFPANVTLLEDGRLKIRGGNGNDLITIAESGGNLEIQTNGSVVIISKGFVREILVWGNDGDDHVINATDVAMKAFGGNGNDTLVGGSGNDLLRGEEGSDSLFGGSGDDLLYGGSGADWLDGGPGSDKLRGGDGIDRFVSDEIDFFALQE